MRRVFVLSDLHLNLDAIDTFSPSFKGRDMNELSTLVEYRRKIGEMSNYGDEWKNHIKRMEQSWDANVGSNDIIIIPGDISHYLSESMLDLAWIDKRPGKKIIGCGNHDKWWPSKVSKKKYYQSQFKSLIFVDYSTDYVDDKIVIMGCRMCDYDFNVWPIVTKQLTEEPLKVKLDEACGKTMNKRLKAILERMQKIREDKRVILMIHHPPFNEKADESEISKMIVDANPDYCLFGHIHNLGRLYSDKKYTNVMDISKRYQAVDVVIEKTHFMCASSDLLRHNVKELMVI
ncbi:Ser/thr protein phosphatase family protein [Entamoeba marina]